MNFPGQAPSTLIVPIGTPMSPATGWLRSTLIHRGAPRGVPSSLRKPPTPQHITCTVDVPWRYGPKPSLVTEYPESLNVAVPANRPGCSVKVFNFSFPRSSKYGAGRQTTQHLPL